MIKIKIPMLIVCLVVFWGNVSIAQDNEHHSGQKTEMFTGVDSPAGKVVMQFHLALRTSDKITARKLLADNVLIFEGGGVDRSADEYAHHHMLSDMKYLAAMKSEPLEHNVKIMGNSAVSMSRSKTMGTYKGKELKYEGMETMVLEKQKGEWKIVRIHWSN
jgi:ketosteroid isomerase-like protein